MNIPQRSANTRTATAKVSSTSTASPADPTNHPAPFLIWSNLHEVAGTAATVDSESHTCTTPSSVAPPTPHLDNGLWLFHRSFLRRQNWFHLHDESFAVPPTRPAYALAKRVCDVAGSLVLLVLLGPLLLFVALLIRLDSPGPALFRQRRVGKGGKQFLLWKFRSMRLDAPRYAPSPVSEADPRLTRVGRLIRRVSIDELPQLLNVLQGNMSLVGPRPEMPFIVAGYTPVERRRLAVKPGITGLWQISPARAFPIHENLQFDLHYIRHQSLVLDAAILLRTVAAVIRGVGAV